jgi:hypothetical protein
VRLSTNARALQGAMRRRAQSVIRELEGAARELAPAVNADAKDILKRRIYSVEIPFKPGTSKRTRERYAGTSGGQRHRQWRRTGDVQNRERARAEGTSIVLTNNSGHAVGRHVLGLPGHRKIRTPGVQSVQWQKEAAERKRRQILERRRQGARRALERR